MADSSLPRAPDASALPSSEFGLALGFIFHPIVVGVAVFGTPAH